MADIMKELGYGFTDDTKNCKNVLSRLLPLTEPTISRIVGTVACTHGGVLEGQNAYPVFLSATGCNPVSDLPELSSWNINVLVGSIKELVSYLFNPTYCLTLLKDHYIYGLICD